MSAPLLQMILPPVQNRKALLNRGCHDKMKIPVAKMAVRALKASSSVRRTVCRRIKPSSSAAICMEGGARSTRWRCEGVQQRGQFAVGTYMLAVEGGAGRGCQAYRKGQQVRLRGVVAIGLGQVGELVHDSDDAAVRGLGEAMVA